MIYVTYIRVEGESKRVVGIRRILSWRERERMLHPLVGRRLGRDPGAPKYLPGQVGDKGGLEAAFVCTLGPEGPSVLLLLDVHAPEATIGEPNSRVRAVGGNIEGRRQCLGQWRGQVLER